ncbi:MAG: exodeoxyribonuclease VII large subunit, partial [Gemmatimonadetes bacterium]|nr:exodeoxyribonuclease VII large subunit [Gemmatimonadota bacterium]
MRVRLEQAFPPLLVEGEVSNLSRHSSGHVYFTLKDDECQLRCALFRTDALRLGFVPQDGECLVLFGRPSLYGKRSEVQMVVSRAFRRGAGKAAEALEALRRRLGEEGLFAQARKRAIPFFPHSIGIVTSPTGAVIHDMLSVVRRRAPGTHVYLLPTRVGGDGAEEEIRDAIDFMNAWFPIDVLIVGRGGGSLEDLAAFNDEGVARAVFRSRVPVISAVGHEVNVTICDQVADVRAPTPSVAAELAVPDCAALRRSLSSAAGRLVTAQERARNRLVRRLDDFLGRYGLRALRARIEDDSRRADELSERMLRGLQRGIDDARAGLREQAGRLDALSPLATLERGYAIVEKMPERRVVRGAGELRVGDELRLRFLRGEARARVAP